MVPRQVSGPIVFISVAQETFVASLMPFFCFLIALGGGVVVLLLPLAVAVAAAADGDNCVT